MTARNGDCDPDRTADLPLPDQRWRASMIGLAQSARPALCPQVYTGGGIMTVEPCTRCGNWTGNACSVPTGAERIPPEGPIADCPLADQCQHSIQARGLCIVRRKGYVCESALATVMSAEDAMNDPRSFNAEMMQDYIASFEHKPWHPEFGFQR